MRSGAFIAMTVLVASATAAAAGSKPIIVFESHVGPRPANLGSLLHAVTDLLETRGYAALPATVLRLAGKNLPRPGILDPELTAADLAELHSRAFALYKAAKWSDALPQLIEARDKTRRNPSLVANDIGNHDLMFQTLVAIADCHKRLGDDRAALAAMREVRRVYPTRPVSRTDAWGPSGEQLYTTLTLDERGVLRGRLSIAAGDPNAQIAVEGQLRGVGNVSISDLLAGTYRVFIRTSARDAGRQYEVVVNPGDETRFAADIDRDELLDATTDYIALTYPSERARKDECKLATHFAKRWTEAEAAVVLASGEEGGRPIIIGMRCRDGVQIRRAVIFTDTDEATSPDKLVPFLDDVTSEEPSAQTRDHAPHPSASTNVAPLWPKLVLGGGAAVLLGSTALYLAWPSDDYTKPAYDDKKTLAVQLYAGGAIVAGFGVGSWLRTSLHTGWLPATLFGASTTSLLAGVMFMVTDEDQHAEGFQRPTYRNTGVPGTILAGAGVGFAVAGYLAWRFAGSADSTNSRPGEHPASVAPVVVPTQDGIAFAMTGSF